ncbi:hypothetical protein AB0I10_23950 [Streptomyces sp. NPDC050636]|uniref:hypothetical protein n=1 Tax=Streptomyces sp. NPDC050636 TaxID=3154510 RepID=UPI00342A4282
MPSSTSSSRGPRPGRVPLLAAVAVTVAAGSLAAVGLNGGPTASAAPTVPASSAPSVTDSSAVSSSASRSGQWQRTPVPVTKGDLTAIAALGDKQAWAVGYRLKSATALEAVALRWDGTSWAQESTLPENSFPQALTVRSADDIWAVGTATEHWDGKTWTTRPLDRDPAGRVVPEAVTTTADGQAWTVGRAMARSIKDSVPAIQTWDGRSWHRQPLPDVGKGELNGVTAVAPDDVWAVGASYAVDEKSPQTALLLHWDGTTWKRVDVDGPAAGHAWLGGITAFAADDIWAVGGRTSGSAERPYTVHWDGAKWSAAETPDVADGRLRAVGRAGGGELWAVGGKGAAPVALRWNRQDKRWDRAAGPGVVVRGFATVPKSAGLWVAGIAEQGDLVPAITRMKG